jgi:leucyl-tRNA synthetase
MTACSIQHLIDAGLGEKQINYRLRDWGVSRQRYWGAPIPMLYLEDGTEVSVPPEELPVLLPEDVEMDGIQSPIKQSRKR